MANERSLSGFDLVCLGVNGIVGSGIYLLPGTLASLLGPASVLAFALSGALSLLIGLAFAELAGRYERSGGSYLYATHAFGSALGYGVGFTCWAAAVLSWAAVTRGLASQLAELLPVLGGPLKSLVLCWGLIGLLAAINIRGVRFGAITTNVLTVAKIAPLLALLAVGLVQLDGARLVPWAPQGFGGLPRATFLAFFAFQGFEIVAVPAGDSRDPRRQAPRALVAALLACTLLYVALQLAALGTTPQLAGSAQPLAAMAGALWGALGERFVALAASISMLGFCAGAALASPRYLEALALDCHVPPGLAGRHPRYQTPARAIIATALPTALLVSGFNFERLVDLSVIFVAVQYLSSTLAASRLRSRGPSSTGYRLPGGPTIPWLATGAVVLLLGVRLREADGLRLVAQSGSFAALGALVWGASRLLRKRS